MSKTPEPLLNSRIMHDALKAACGKINVLLESKDLRDGAIIPLLGPPRVGKSEISRRLIANADPVKCGQLFPSRTREVVRASIPAQPNSTNLYTSILEALNVRHTSEKDKDKLRERVYRAIREWSIKLIILDEVNHFVERGSRLSQRAASDQLKSLVDETGVSLILCGLPSFQTILRQNEQLRDRSCATVFFKPYDWQSGDDREAFMSTVETAIESLETSRFSFEIKLEDLTRRLYGASGGRVPMMLRILKSVVSSPDIPAQIKLLDLERVAKRILHSTVSASFFHAEEPDETRLFASYAAVMAEAGLEYDVRTAFAFEAKLDGWATL